ncbi:S8 family serine peptidase [Bergeyella porcorum]|uniref:S8 family serine peptidase n=1 Tax=Bergeyella porcorum TaxID=1735111 RepID=UPI0035ED77CD
MKKSTKVKALLGNGLLPIAAGFMLMPSFFFAQTEKQLQAIKKETDFQALKVFQANKKKNTLTTKQLQLKAKEKGLLFSGESKGQYFQLKGFDRKTGKPIYYITTNAGAALGTATNKLNSSAGIFNLDGEGMKVHEWDGGAVNVAHREFGGRVVQKDKPSSNSSHATHVAGTMVASGVDAKAKGMAPKALLDTYDWTDDETEMVSAAMDGAILSNHSYGYLSGFVWGDYSGMTGWHWIGSDEDTEYKLYGKYTQSDREWDVIAQNAPFYLPVKAAGNPRGDGPEPGETHYVQVYNESTQKWEWKSSTKNRQKNGGEFGFDSVNQGGLGKNILVVGAAEKINGGYQKSSDVKMASFSAFGPVDDGRIKPDISGIGVGIYSTNTGGVAAYTTMGGTSMASPNVTGSLLLLQEHYKNLNNGAFMKAATLKALAIATANEAGDAPGPDYKSGWGLLNAYKAATAISTNGKYALISEKTLRNSTQDKISVTASGSEPLVVTIAWTDPAPKDLPSEDTLNERLATLVNDLDVRVRKNGEEFLPWKLNPEHPANAAEKGDNTVDNVEQIVIESPEAGAVYEIVVGHKGNLRKNKLITDANGDLQIDLENTTTQDYSLVVTGVNAGVKQDLTVKKINVKAELAEYGSQTPVEFEIENKGVESTSGGVLNYELINVDTGISVTSGSENLTDIPAGGVLKIEKTLDLSRSFVNYKIVAQVLLSGDEVAVNDKEEALVYGIVADLRPDETTHTFGFEDDFTKNGWQSEDVDADGSTWRKYESSGLAYKGTNFAINLAGGVKGTNDWLFSNPIKLKGGALYRVVLHTRKFQELEEGVQLFWGTEPKVTAMTNPIGQRIEVADFNQYTQNHFEFTVPSDQTVYIGFNHLAAADIETYAVALDEVVVQHAEMKPVVDFAASKVNPNTYETVSFQDKTLVASTQPVLSRQWIIEPATFEFKENTSAASENPKVRFTAEGTYKVILKVTNAKGEAEAVKEAYITAKNVAARAGFNAAVTSIFEGEQIAFRNTSTGNPLPTEFKWTITPSEGVEFVDSTDASLHPKVKFNKMGTYSVALEVKSEQNTHSIIRENYITVNRIYNEARDLKYSLDNASKEVHLTWERPIMNILYQESFETDANASGWTVINENRDGYTWVPLGAGYKGKAIASLSWFYGGPFDADDWLITPKMRAGAEVLRFMMRVPYPERYDFYVVEAPESGETPTVEQLKAGYKFLTNEAQGTIKTYTLQEFNIKDHTNKDFFIAFHHRTKASDDGSALIIDELEIGYDNTLPKSNSGKQVDATQYEDYKSIIKTKERVVTSEEFSKPKVMTSEVIQPFGFIDIPRLTGYRIEKNDVALVTKDGVDNRTHTDAISENGSYTYKVYGVYSDGKESEPVSVTIDIANLSTSDVKKEGLKIYPNPSDGRFVVEAGSGVTSLKAEVYDMSGKQIYKQDFRGSKADLNLTQYPKGVYILNLVDNNGKKQSAKLMIK